MGQAAWILVHYTRSQVNKCWTGPGIHNFWWKRRWRHQSMVQKVHKRSKSRSFGRVPEVYEWIFEYWPWNSKVDSYVWKCIRRHKETSHFTHMLEANCCSEVQVVWNNAKTFECCFHFLFRRIWIWLISHNLSFLLLSKVLKLNDMGQFIRNLMTNHFSL